MITWVAHFWWGRGTTGTNPAKVFGQGSPQRGNKSASTVQTGRETDFHLVGAQQRE